MTAPLLATRDALTGFLLARIAEDKADAEKRGTWAVGHSERCIFEGGYEGTTSCNCGAVARLLAECEAKRRIVEELAPAVDYDRDRFIVQSTLEAAATASLRALALPYADHADYRPEWRP